MNQNKNITSEIFSDRDVVQVLALDGGGLKGLYTISVLASYEKQLGRPLADHFDIITGTSTGALIALALGLRIPCEKIQEFYIEHGHKIFPYKHVYKLWRLVRVLFSSMYSNHYLEMKLKELLTLEEKIKEPLLKDSRSRLVIPTFRAGEVKPRLLKTPHAARYKSDWKMPMWAVGMASSAAPLYFPPFKHKEHTYIDGGVWANNPSLIGVLEAVDLGANIKNIRVLNIGTTYSASEKIKNKGLFGWAFRILSLVMEANSHAMSDMYIHQLLAKGNLYKINRQVNRGAYSLDKIDNDVFVEMGVSCGERTFSQVSALFEHKPKNYIPDEEAVRK